MKQKTFVLREQANYDSLFKFLDENSKDQLLEVTVREHQKDRSILQNSLMWTWVGIIADDLGWTKEDVHKDLRKRILSPIYERDDYGYAATLKALRDMYSRGYEKEAEDLFYKITSTTSATMKQFAEYLTQIERDSILKNIILPHPEDRYYESLMIKTGGQHGSNGKS